MTGRRQFGNRQLPRPPPSLAELHHDAQHYARRSSAITRRVSSTNSPFRYGRVGLPTAASSEDLSSASLGAGGNAVGAGSVECRWAFAKASTFSRTRRNSSGFSFGNSAMISSALMAKASYTATTCRGKPKFCRVERRCGSSSGFAAARRGHPCSRRWLRNLRRFTPVPAGCCPP